MLTFIIHHGVKLNATGKNLVPFQRYSTDNEEEIAELREYGQKFKLCTEVVTEKKVEKKSEAPVANEDDLSLMKGVIGKATAEKLAALDITTQSALKAALADEKTEAAVREAVGEAVVTKMVAFFDKKAQENK